MKYARYRCADCHQLFPIGRGLELGIVEHWLDAHGLPASEILRRLRDAFAIIG